MDLIVDNMSEHYASQIVCWNYEPPYDFYNSSASPEGIKELMEQPYYAVLDPYGELIGFFCIGESAQVPAGKKFGAYLEGFIDIGLGMKPELTGKGLGFTFFSRILDYVYCSVPGIPLRLTVASFNERAVGLYRKAGFEELMRFYRGPVEFIVMTKN
ncbi:GNAT family N-acetyltransferase [Neobacillus sp. SCS-31]|uniref:GNAT family N-acetyltransferase n=1 Tax=Neobacillus oceani TaxID=3115292 RepID=UPI00390668F0